MKKNDVFTGIVKETHFPNKGIIVLKDVNEIDFPEGLTQNNGNHMTKEWQNATIVVKNALPGQQIRFQLTKTRRKHMEGRLVEVIGHAPIEDGTPSCEYFGKCGGCRYQTMSYKKQLQYKNEQVMHLLQEVIPDYQQDEVLGSPIAYNYRNKMEFSFGDEYKDGPLSLGQHKAGSFYDILNVPHCQIVHSDFGKLQELTLALATQYGYSYYHKMSHVGYLRHLMVRRATKTGEILVNLVTTTQKETNEAEFLQSWKNSILNAASQGEIEGQITGILHIENDSLSDVVQSDETHILYGQDYFEEELLGLTFRITPFSFFQTNSLGAEVLYNRVREYIGETKEQVIFDLYSGTGTIAQMVAPVAKQVIGVEIVEEAVVAARENAIRNDLSNCEFVAGDVLKVIDSIKERPDFIILDPPRDGIHPKALEKILAYGVERMVYISCKPTSLARDLVAIQAAGYRVERVGCVDMFPWTTHVETIVALHRTNS